MGFVSNSYGRGERCVRVVRGLARGGTQRKGEASSESAETDWGRTYFSGGAYLGSRKPTGVKLPA